MAAEEKNRMEDEGEEIEKQKKKKKGGKSFVLVIVIAVAVLAGGGGAFFFLTKAGGEKGAKKEEQQKKEESSMFSLEPFVVNLSDQANNKFLKVSMQLELSGQALQETAKSKTPQIRDAIINLLTSKTSESLMSPEGKLQLKDEINMQVNQILGNNSVKNVYLTEFVMQ